MALELMPFAPTRRRDEKPTLNIQPPLQSRTPSPFHEFDASKPANRDHRCRHTHRVAAVGFGRVRHGPCEQRR